MVRIGAGERTEWVLEHKAETGRSRLSGLFPISNRKGSSMPALARETSFRRPIRFGGLTSGPFVMLSCGDGGRTNGRL